MKPVKSTDVRKPKLLNIFKLLSGGNKVTNIREDKHYFYGDCMLGNRKGYRKLGTFYVNKNDTFLVTNGFDYVVAG